MKTARRENPNPWAAKLSNRAHGTEGQNRSCSDKWAEKQEKIQPLAACFFLASPFRERIRTQSLISWKTEASNSKISAWNPRPPPRNPLAESLKVPVIFAPIYIPLLFIAGVVSIPWAYIQKSRHSCQERRFAEQMNQAGRLMQWQEFKPAVANGKGTAIGEYLSMTGPFRLWWTPDDIPAAGPHKWKREQHIAWMEEEFLPFFQWCYARYTNPQSGLAQQVPVPEEERNQLKAMLTSSRFVSTCSFRLLRSARS